MKKRVITLALAVLLCFVSVIPAFAENGFADEYYRVIDKPIILSQPDRVALLEKLDEISIRQKMDVVVMITKSLDGDTIEEYADDAYDVRSYGYGENRDGVLLLIDMETKSWYITTCGYGKTAFTDSGIKHIGEQMMPYLSNEDYAGAFNVYAEKCDEFITLARNGTPFDLGEDSQGSSDSSEEPKKPLSLVWIPVSIVIGIVVAFFVVKGMKNNLKSVKKKKEANSYVRNGSMVLTENYDTFLYSEVTKTEIQKQNNSGSSTHTSSSGTSHGGGGGSF